MKKLSLYVFLGLLWCSNAFTETSNFEWIKNQTEFETSADLCFKDDKDRFKKFLSSDLFHNQPSNSKSDYWNYHSNEIKYTIKNSILNLKGESGNYIPDKKNSYQFFSRSIKILIKKSSLQ